MKCQCGYNNEQGALFCVGCGKALSGSEGSGAFAETPGVSEVSGAPGVSVPEGSAGAAGASTGAAETAGGSAGGSAGSANTAAPQMPPPPVIPPPPQMPPPPYVQPPQMPPVQSSPIQPPPVYTQPPAYPVRSSAVPAPFSLTDVYIIIGFVLALFGVFAYAVVLLPASIIFSVIGWRRKTNRRTNNLAIAALIVGISASVIKLAVTLDNLGWIPSWLRDGIF